MPQPSNERFRRVGVCVMGTAVAALTACVLALGVFAAAAQPAPAAAAYELNDSHLHSWNYIQQGPTLPEILKVMGAKVGRAAIFGLPLQQMWAYSNSGDFAPYYYTQTDAPLYYYSFVDAMMAMAYRSLTPEQQARLDPMIIGFNPADMYAVDHIKRVLLTFPGVFSGIGEFSIHKEFVSAKTAGGPASLTDPALDRIFEFCAESGLVVLLHCDVDTPFPRTGQDPYQARQLGALFRRHPKTTTIWAHIGLGRVVHPIHDMIGMVRRALDDPTLAHVNFDISWDETAKYLVATPETITAVAAMINEHPDRFLFGTDEVGPTDQAKYLKVYDIYAPLLARLTPEARAKVLKGNYERLFDQARVKVRAWEKANMTK